MTLSEDQLCEAFADAVRDRQEVRFWLLGQTKFAKHAQRAILLDKEQMAIRKRERWWRHWWCHVPDLNKDRETDIFMVFEVESVNSRFALHIENKKDNYRFNDGQAHSYRPRALYMMNDSRFLSYSDFETILLAPTSFRNRYRKDVELFDVFLAYEDVSLFLPSFGPSVV